MAPANGELLQGTLELLLLRILDAGPRHGYAIARRIEQISGQALAIAHGSLYPALHRLETKGLVETYWDRTETGRRARYYRLTPKGRQQLGNETTSWRQFARAVELVLQHG